MTELEKLQIVLPGANVELLTLLLEDTLTDLLAWTNRNTLPRGLEPTQRQIAVIRYNMQGVEGQTSHSEGGVSRSFEALPADIRQSISQYRLIKVVGRHAP
ncbi:MAG: phage head-tail connector protein [Gorillibacterium sp.]|nr:phage head-tail connector protein [Gorillibacterium sp.]